MARLAIGINGLLNPKGLATDFCRETQRRSKTQKPKAKGQKSKAKSQRAKVKSQKSKVIRYPSPDGSVSFTGLGATRWLLLSGIDGFDHGANGILCGHRRRFEQFGRLPGARGERLPARLRHSKKRIYPAWDRRVTFPFCGAAGAVRRYPGRPAPAPCAPSGVPLSASRYVRWG